MGTTSITATAEEWPDRLADILDQYGMYLTSLDVQRSRDGSTIVALVGFDGSVPQVPPSKRELRLAALEQQAASYEPKLEALQAQVREWKGRAEQAEARAAELEGRVAAEAERRVAAEGNYAEAAAEAERQRARADAAEARAVGRQA